MPWQIVGIPVSYGQTMVDHEAPVPIWRQVYDVLRGQIESGALAPDRPVPSITRLQQEYGIARGTAVKALQKLIEDGLAYTVQGKGTYVANR